MRGIWSPNFPLLVHLSAGRRRWSNKWVAGPVQSAVPRQYLSPLARYIAKVSVDCGFWGPCSDIYNSLLFNCRSKHIHAITNRSGVGMGLLLVPLARRSHTGSRQRWNDCRLMCSQSCVAPRYCKVNPAPTQLETAREVKAADPWPIPWSYWWLMKDTRPRCPRSPGGFRMCLWRWHLVRGRLPVPAELVCRTESVCVSVSVWWWDRGEVRTRWALEPLGTWIHEQLWKET